MQQQQHHQLTDRRKPTKGRRQNYEHATMPHVEQNAGDAKLNRMKEIDRSRVRGRDNGDEQKTFAD